MMIPMTLEIEVGLEGDNGATASPGIQSAEMNDSGVILQDELKGRHLKPCPRKEPRAELRSELDRVQGAFNAGVGFSVCDPKSDSA